MGASSVVRGVVDHFSILVRQTDMSDNNDPDRWNIGSQPVNSNAITTTNYRWVSIVDEVILSSTILGALVILGSMFLIEYKGRAATTRMRIVQSLVLSDLILGIIGLIGTSIVLSGTPLANGTPTCNGLGYCLTAVLWTEHLWTLILAIATYMILIYPLHPVTLWLERRWYYLWLLVWVLACGISLIGYLLFGYFPNGGICYYGSNSGLYGELAQFVPRAFVMLSITILYAKLFVFLRRPDRIRASFSNSDNDDLYISSNHRSRHFFRSRALSSMIRKGAAAGAATRESKDRGLNRPGVDQNEKINHGEKSVRIDLPARRSHHNFEEYASADQLSPRDERLEPILRPIQATPPPTPDEPAPWEQVQLPIFHIDGERFGGREASSTTQNARAGSSGLQRESSTMWSGWKGMSKDRPTSSSAGRVHRHSTASSTTPPTSSRSRFNSVSVPLKNDSPGSPKSMLSNTIPAPDEIPEFDGDDKTPTQTRYNAGDIWQSTKVPTDRQGSISSASLAGRMEQLRKGSTLSTYKVNEDDERTPYSRSGSMSSASRRGSQIPHLSTIRNSQDIASHHVELKGVPLDESSAGEKSRPTVSQNPTQSQGQEEEETEQGDGAWDLMTMLQASAPVDGARSQREGEEGFELVEESMASYLNRKTALLMLWFPLGYVLLFSVSLIRIIYDFGGQPPIELRALSRWFIFSQGVLDALIYGLVEWHTKRVVRKRVRKGTFNTPAGSRGTNNGTGLGAGSALNALKAIGQGSRQLFPSRMGSGSGQGQSVPGITSQTRSRSGSQDGYLRNLTPKAQQTSVIPPIPEGMTVQQQLEMDDGTETEGLGSAGSGSGFELEEDSTRKGSTASEAWKDGVGGLDTDGRSRERRKGD